MPFEDEGSPFSSSFYGYPDQLAAACPVMIGRPANSSHPRCPKIVYPLDYGYLEGSSAVDGGGADIYNSKNMRTLLVRRPTE